MTDRTSNAIASISSNLVNRTARVTFKTGHAYLYSNLSRRAILMLKFIPTVSLGFWVNRYCVNGDAVRFQRIDQYAYGNGFARI